MLVLSCLHLPSLSLIRPASLSRSFLVGLAISVQVALPLLGGSALLFQGSGAASVPLLFLAGLMVSADGSVKYSTQNLGGNMYLF